MTAASSRNKASTKLLRLLLTGLTALLLAFALVGSGLFLCSAPIATQTLSSLFSRGAGSPFTHEELLDAAMATRDYTVGGHNRDEMVKTIYRINKSAADAGRNTLEGAPDLSDTTEATSTDELALRFTLASDRYVLSNDALSHLDDVYNVISTAQIALIICAILGIIGCIIIAFIAGRKCLGYTLMAAASLVIAMFAALAVWVIADFNSFFTFLHSLFFAKDTWTFSFDSLLIRMYPTEFWVGMGATWLVTTTLFCVICFITGLAIKGRKRLL